jgi:hypothetical protein
MPVNHSILLHNKCCGRALERAVLIRRRPPETKINPHIQVAEPATEIVEEMERDAGASEEKSALPKKEGIEVAVQDDHAEKGRCSK